MYRAFEASLAAPYGLQKFPVKRAGLNRAIKDSLDSISVQKVAQFNNPGSKKVGFSFAHYNLFHR